MCDINGGNAAGEMLGSQHTHYAAQCRLQSLNTTNVIGVFSGPSELTPHMSPATGRVTYIFVFYIYCSEQRTRPRLL